MPSCSSRPAAWWLTARVLSTPLDLWWSRLPTRMVCLWVASAGWMRGKGSLYRRSSSRCRRSPVSRRRSKRSRGASRSYRRRSCSAATIYRYGGDRGSARYLLHPLCCLPACCVRPAAALEPLHAWPQSADVVSCCVRPSVCAHVPAAGQFGARAQEGRWWWRPEQHPPAYLLQVNVEVR